MLSAQVCEHYIDIRGSRNVSQFVLCFTSFSFHSIAMHHIFLFRRMQTTYICECVRVAPRQAFRCVLRTVCVRWNECERRIIIMAKKTMWIVCCACRHRRRRCCLFGALFSFYFYSHSLSSVWIFIYFFLLSFFACAFHQSNRTQFITAYSRSMSVVYSYSRISKRNRLH